jgi:6-phosphogluconolactonase
MGTGISDNVKIEIINDREFAGSVADEIVTTISEVLEEKERCAICLSGGTTPAAVYRLLGLPPRVSDIDWSRVTLFWGDERFVPADDPLSNYKMASQTLIQQIPNRTEGFSVISINTALSSPEVAAEDYSLKVKTAGYYIEYTSDSKHAGPPFDIVLLGLGEDGHYASVFPSAETLDLSENVARIAYATKNPVDDTARITLAPEAIFLSPHVFFIVSGQNKSGILSEVFKTPYSPEAEAKIPAIRTKLHTATVLWLIDSSAASEL